MPDRGAFRDATVYVVGDDRSRTQMLETVLRENRTARATVVGAASIARRLRTRPPDLLLLRDGLHHHGLTLVAELQRQVADDDHVPLLVVTDEPDPSVHRRARELGATDVLLEPFDADELTQRIRNHLSARRVVSQLHDDVGDLERRLEKHMSQLQQRTTDQLELLHLALRARDAATAEHSDRVGVSAGRLAVAVGCSAEVAEQIRLTAPLHDIGKLGTPDAILNKPTELTTDERAIMQQHTIVGARMLGASRAPLLELAASIALSHHERWDGRGYPYGIAGEQIPAASRVAAVADVFDALTHRRPYKPAWPVEWAVAELERVAGSQLDPALVRAFVTHCVTDLDTVPAPVRGRCADAVIDITDAAFSSAGASGRN